METNQILATLPGDATLKGHGGAREHDRCTVRDASLVEKWPCAKVFYEVTTPRQLVLMNEKLTRELRHEIAEMESRHRGD